MVIMLSPAVFLDRDNTINRDVPYCSRPEDMELLPRVCEAIILLNEHGFKVVVVTNQSGVARGYFSEKALIEIHRRMCEKLTRGGARIDAIYFCPHHPDAGCQCRKPSTALVLRAAEDMHLDIGRSFVVGDSAADIEMGKRLGCRTVRIRTVGVEGSERNIAHQPDFTSSDLYQAASWIISQTTGA